MKRTKCGRLKSVRGRTVYVCVWPTPLDMDAGQISHLKAQKAKKLLCFMDFTTTFMANVIWCVWATCAFWSGDWSDGVVGVRAKSRLSDIRSFVLFHCTGIVQQICLWIQSEFVILLRNRNGLQVPIRHPNVLSGVEWNRTSYFHRQIKAPQ